MEAFISSCLVNTVRLCNGCCSYGYLDMLADTSYFSQKHNPGNFRAKGIGFVIYIPSPLHPCMFLIMPLELVFRISTLFVQIMDLKLPLIYSDYTILFFFPFLNSWEVNEDRRDELLCISSFVSPQSVTLLQKFIQLSISSRGNSFKSKWSLRIKCSLFLVLTKQ